MNTMESTHPGRGNSAVAITILGLALVLGGVIIAPLFSMQLASSASLPTDLKDFSGTWQGEFRGHTFVLLNLRLSGNKLMGTCIHTVTIEKNSAGELTRVGDRNTEDQILDAHQDGRKLLLKIADNGNAQNAMQCAFWLTSKNEAALQVLSSDSSEWKPWKMTRTPAVSPR
jgi:hypothetical protein